MNKYPDSPQRKGHELKEPGESLELDLPIDPGFLSVPPRLDPQAMLQRIAETLAWRSTRPGETERRAGEKIDVEFIL